MKLRRVWTSTVDGRALHAMTRVVEGLAVYEYVPYAKNAGRVLRAMQGDGMVAWLADWPYIELSHVYGDSLYLGGSHARRVDIRSGRLLAERRYGEDANIQPPVDGGPVYSDQDRMMGLNPNDLSIVWEVPDPEQELVAHGNRVCRYRRDGSMSHIDLATMRESPPVAAPPRLSDAGYLHVHLGDLWCLFYVSEGGRTAIDERTGEVRWHFDDPKGHWLPVFVGDRAYSVGGGGLSAYDLRTGERIWHQPCGPEPRPLCGSPYIGNGRAYVGSSDGFILIVDIESGDLLLRQRVDFEPETVRPLGDSRLIAGWMNGIHCYELSGA